jgi:PEP-CTERM motif
MGGIQKNGSTFAFWRSAGRRLGWRRGESKLMHKSISKLLVVTTAVAVVGLAGAPQAEADPFTITSVLTGDFRAGNPDNLVVNVTITGDTTSNVTNWLVDLDMASVHPDATLGVFAFNILTTELVSFSNFSPSTWTVTSGDNVPGSGSADFRFETNDPAGSANNVTNLQSLSFNATLGTGNWSLSNFLSAPYSTGGGIPDPGAQLGAHIRSLDTAGCTGCSDSGFASGNYQSVPEPTTLLLMGLGIVGAGIRRARR